MARAAAIIRRRKRLGGGGSVPVELVAPVLTHSDRIVDDLPDFSIALTDPVVGDVVTLRRSSTSNFASYEDATCAIDSLSPLTTLTFNYGSGEWAAQTWYTKCFFTRNGSESPHSNTESFTLEADGVEVDFVNNLAFVRDTTTAANVFTGAPNSLLTKTVSANGTYINSSGVITQKTANTIHIDYDPSTLLPLGIPIWEARTNILLNSAINGTSLATQSVTTSATAYTLSFYGTGTITLSGTSTAGPLVGTGAYPNRVTLTFTPTAGTLTLTVSGTVQYAQLEAGAFATPFIPTAGSSVTRAADSISIATTAFNHSATAGTIFAEVTTVGDYSTDHLMSFSDGTSNEVFLIRYLSSTNPQYVVQDGGVNQAGIDAGTPVSTAAKFAAAWAANDFAASYQGGAVGTDASGTLPTVTTIYFGSLNGGAQLNGHVRRAVHVPRRMTNAELQALTT